jgi:hypothetical protein
MSKPTLTKSLLSLVIVFFGVYIGLVNSLVLNVSERGHLSETLSQTTSRSAALESQLVALSGSVTLDLAYQLGFHDAAPEDVLVLRR